MNNFDNFDIKNNFLYGFKQDDFEGINPIIQNSFNMTNASKH